MSIQHRGLSNIVTILNVNHMTVDEALQHSIEDHDVLLHYGVKGMKWDEAKKKLKSELEEAARRLKRKGKKLFNKYNPKLQRGMKKGLKVLRREGAEAMDQIGKGINRGIDRLDKQTKKFETRGAIEGAFKTLKDDIKNINKYDDKPMMSTNKWQARSGLERLADNLSSNLKNVQKDIKYDVEKRLPRTESVARDYTKKPKEKTGLSKYNAITNSGKTVSDLQKNGNQKIIDIKNGRPSTLSEYEKGKVMNQQKTLQKRQDYLENNKTDAQKAQDRLNSVYESNNKYREKAPTVNTNKFKNEINGLVNTKRAKEIQKDLSPYLESIQKQLKKYMR